MLFFIIKVLQERKGVIMGECPTPGRIQSQVKWLHGIRTWRIPGLEKKKTRLLHETTVLLGHPQIGF